MYGRSQPRSTGLFLTLCAAMLLLAFSFAFEILRPALTVGDWQFTNLEVLQFFLAGAWFAAPGSEVRLVNVETPPARFRRKGQELGQVLPSK